MRDKITCVQFITAVSDGFIKWTLQLENIHSLKTAIERAMTIKVIQENSFEKNNYKFKRNAKETENRDKRTKFNENNCSRLVRLTIIY